MLNALQVLRTHFSAYKKNFLWILFLSVASPFFESMGVLMFLPIFSIFLAKNAAADPILLQEYIDALFNFLGWEVSIINLMLIIIPLLFSKAIFLYLGETYIIKLSEIYRYNLREKLFWLYSNAKWEFFTSQKRGFLLEYLVTTPAQNMNLLKSVSKSLAAFFSILTYFTFSLFFSFELTFAAILLALLLFSFYFQIMKKIKFYGNQAMFSGMGITKVIEQFLSGFKTLKAFGVAQKAHDEFEEKNSIVKNSFIKLNQFRIAYKVSSEFAVSIFLLALLLIAVEVFHYPVAKIVIVTIFLGRCLQQLNQLQNLGSVAAQLPGIELIEKVINEFSSQEDENLTSKEEIIPFKQKIELQNLSFSYASNEKSKNNSDASLILDAISLKIEKGTMIGIVGGSGAGKSTFIDVLMGLLKPSAGEVYIDDKALSKISQLNWSKQIAYVPQDTFLLHDTIAQNIAFYRDITESKIIEAAKLANCYDFIQETEEGFKTIVGDNGIKLSGGQRQRIALARALVASPQLLILDEATSALDSKSENIIQASIEKIRNNLTIISIAHRLSTIANADTIIVLEKGKIAEQGSQKELLDKKGLFYQMYQEQEKINL